MILLHGEHVLSDSYTKCKEPLPDNGYFIYDLETFEMIGTEPAHNVVVILSVGVHLMNISMSHFKSISFYNTSNSKDDNAGVSGYEVREVRHYSQSVFIAVLNRALFNGVVPNQYGFNLYKQGRNNRLFIDRFELESDEIHKAV